MSRLCVRVNYKNCNNQAIFNRGIALKVNNSLIKTQTFTPDNYTMYYLASQTGAIDICSGTVKELEQLGELKFVPDKLHFATLKLSADTTLCTDKNCLLYCFYENSVQKKVNLTSIEQQR